MLSIKIKTNEQICADIGYAYKKQRLMKNMTRDMLSKSSNVPVPTIKNFETTGKISLDSLISISKVLNKDDVLSILTHTDTPETIEEFRNQRRKRARV